MTSPTNEQQRVDVLAVMAAQMEIVVESDYNGAAHDYLNLLAARSAVAELIEAARNASAILGHAYHTQIRGELEQDAHDAYQRLDAALANVGSQP